jgi:hypothetical protein
MSSAGKPEVIVGAGYFLQESRHVDHAEVVGPERAQADDAEVLIPDHDRIGRAPLVAREQPRGDVIHVGLERRLEAIFPPLKLRQHRDIVGGERVLSRSEQIAELSKIDKLHRLRLTDDELSAALDFLVLIREPEREGVARVVGPLDDLDQLAFDEVHQTHARASPLTK